MLRLGEAAQLAQREMRRGVQTINIRKPQDDIVEFLRACPEPRADALQKADRRPEEDKSLDLEGNDPLSGCLQNALGARGAFDIAAIIAPGKLGLDDIQFAVSDQEVDDGDENSGADPGQKSNQRDDRGDDQDKDVVAKTKAMTGADQPFVDQAEREHDQERAYHDL